MPGAGKGRVAFVLELHFGLIGRKCGGGEGAGDGQEKGVNFLLTYARM